MSHLDTLITDNLDLWSAAVRPKSSAGRGSNSKLELTGIKKLRELILELAVRGKLVPQDPSDEPASVLLERITAEKAQLVKEGKIKKPKALPEIGEEEKPFELPEGWVITRLGEIGIWATGNGFPTNEQGLEDLEILFCKVSDMNLDGNERFILKTMNTVSENTARRIKLNLHKAGTVIFPKIGGAIATNKRRIITKATAIDNNCLGITPCSEVASDYLFLLLTSIDMTKYQVGTSVPALSQGTLELIPIGIPSIDEQHRIVAKVDELMALCDQLEQRSESQLAAHQTLVETLLATLTDCADADELVQSWARLSTHFDTLFTTEASIDALKQTILQLAVMGKLVPQDSSDEPAIDLLNRLVSKRDEWLKKESKENSEAMTMLRKLKKLTVPTAPFELPKAWACAHLIQLSQMLVDCHNKTAPYVEVGIPIVRTTNIRERQFIDRDLKFVSKETYYYWSRRCPPEPGDIIFTREAPMGEALIIPAGETWCLGQRTMLIRPMHEFVSNKFLLLALTEPHLLERASEHAVGLTVKHLRVGDVENLSIPLPPLAEQHRIVAKVDELMALCDQLKSRLQTSQQTQLALAESLVEGALA
ncbi:restriction endonuclease subunit S [Aeromonas australiensis]|uniref:restriction endonuclease subunit S n=1 Tax=Aeromonas australiensis TaxID=1114880 RepID=UPI001F251E44|nr:restriction endonuclease subunit S [Aeromonas australiensis]MCF3095992.1 restriction endonuclease subunit S [Aeromonas australiensis]